LNKIDNGLSNKPKRLNKMFTSILAPLFLVKLFLKSKFYAPCLKYFCVVKVTRYIVYEKDRNPA